MRGVDPRCQSRLIQQVLDLLPRDGLSLFSSEEGFLSLRGPPLRRQALQLRQGPDRAELVARGVVVSASQWILKVMITRQTIWDLSFT